MRTVFSLSPSDEQLIEVATALIATRGEVGRHHIASALLTADGRTFKGLHISAVVGTCSICAEAVAIGQAQLEGPASIKTIVSVRKNFDESDEYEIVSPCGLCRERILQFGPNARVLVTGEAGVTASAIKDLLPNAFMRRKQLQGPNAVEK